MRWAERLTWMGIGALLMLIWFAERLKGTCLG